MHSLAEIVEAYEQYLAASSPGQHARFVQCQQTAPETARAEAALFSLLQAEGFEVSPLADRGTGGADFLCQASEGEFVVEVSALRADPVTASSGGPEGEEAGVFRFVTDLLRERASGKGAPLSREAVPRLLCVTTEHERGAFLVGTAAAETLLRGHAPLSARRGRPAPQVKVVPDLEDAVFFRFTGPHAIALSRPGISALLLVHLGPYDCGIVGVLHPQPHCPFPAQLLPTIPFVRARRWPPREGSLELEWVGVSAARAGRTAVARFPYVS